MAGDGPFEDSAASESGWPGEDADRPAGARDPAKLLGMLASTVESLLSAQTWRWSPDDVSETIITVHEVVAQLSALRGLALVEARTRGPAGRVGASDLAGWLAERLLLPQFEANRMVAQARDLFESPYRATGEALATARISPSHAQVIVECMRAMPADLPDAVRVQAELFLVEQAGLMDWKRLKKAAIKLREQLTAVDTSPGGDDPHEDGRTGEHSRSSNRRRTSNTSSNDGSAGSESGEAGGNGAGGNADEPPGRTGGGTTSGRDPRAARSLTFSDTSNGTTVIHGELDAESAALLRTALDALSAPAPAQNGERDPRSPARRRADALVEFVRRALSANVGPAAGGTRPHLNVTISWETLFAHAAEPGMTDWGLPLPREVIKRICCDAEVTRIILDPNGVPLDVGRSERIVPTNMRRALVNRDQMCTFPHCDRPPSWCQAHHVKTWLEGGLTKLDNLVLLCDHHHDRVHQEKWEIVMSEDRRPSFIPPAFIDPQRRPRRNPNCQPLPDLFGDTRR
ncbi:HNH endonuclease signature motif containing protein [Frankia sp. R82]|uniref:HNH endonuclease signature motif containing protein n=1 Tax=Frankia sp. R82 TaxID=2950553 RepID=UPI002043FA5D|nr:HNH endonuclease signature motif containing protein [Frankia sp. R82]MCM3887621.1 HNH endonuclease [Frankia sp. R82]